MGKAVFLHRDDSTYDDELDVRYDFPKTYLEAVRQAVGDWIVYYEPVKAGPRGYFAVAKVQQVIPSRVSKDAILRSSNRKPSFLSILKCPDFWMGDRWKLSCRMKLVRRRKAAFNNWPFAGCPILTSHAS